MLLTLPRRYFSHWYDILYLNAVAMFLHPFTKWAWASYVLVVLFLAYKLYQICMPAKNMLAGLASQQYAGEAQEADGNAGAAGPREPVQKRKIIRGKM